LIRRAKGDASSEVKRELYTLFKKSLGFFARPAAAILSALLFSFAASTGHPVASWFVFQHAVHSMRSWVPASVIDSIEEMSDMINSLLIVTMGSLMYMDLAGGGEIDEEDTYVESWAGIEYGDDIPF
jgi:hypothetical protein